MAAAWNIALFLNRSGHSLAKCPSLPQYRQSPRSERRCLSVSVRGGRNLVGAVLGVGIFVGDPFAGVLVVRGVVVMSSSIGVDPSWAANQEGEGVVGVGGAGSV